ncbi:uncharacterized protein LOC126655649 isoform X2 [Mercurialis annua]|uniref:uncharacterized protein LOC126655649 isoform X2 n=1 Tax=Mercurialis annua TaxID=3986 RepID=UPI0024AD0DD1|nr:uncharacterized protein LOC126655649 isoform X2 [Mercurialis annua]
MSRGSELFSDIGKKSKDLSTKDSNSDQKSSSSSYSDAGGALWSSRFKENSPDTESLSTTDSQPPQQQASSTVVDELVNSLNKQRLYREVTLALRTGLKDARAEFSFLRLRGLHSLLNFLRSVAESDSQINLFCQTQLIPELQVVPVLFEHSFKEAEDDKVENLNVIFGVEPLKITSPSTSGEIALALRVLEGCCLLHGESTILAHQHKAVEDFEVCNGIEEVAVLIRDKQMDENLRLKCGEFLLLFIGHINRRERPPMFTIHEDIRRLLGETSASLIWAASQFGSTLDPEQRMTALHIQSRRVLESLDLY